MEAESDPTPEDCAIEVSGLDRRYVADLLFTYAAVTQAAAKRTPLINPERLVLYDRSDRLLALARTLMPAARTTPPN